MVGKASHSMVVTSLEFVRRHWNIWRKWVTSTLANINSASKCCSSINTLSTISKLYFDSLLQNYSSLRSHYYDIY